MQYSLPASQVLVKSQADPLQNPSEIRIKDVLRLLWRRKLLIVSLNLACVLAVVAATFIVQKKYSAEILIEPNSDTGNEKGGALGALGSTLGALAGLGSASDPKKVESVAILQSEALTERYIRENNLLPILYSSKWDAAHSRWTVSDPNSIPTLWKANEFFRKNVRSIITDAKTGLVTLKVTWKDPAVAANWANGLVAMANDYERDRAIAESERNIAYLTSQAGKTEVIGIQQVIYSLLETEYNTAMLARGNPEFAFKIIDPAVVPEKASFPDRTLWVLTALFTSFSLTVFVAFCFVVWQDD
jgi:uncharacterized protein involved in exopolysaccharide biosynthesis